MPITGTKLFVAGDVLTAAQMNQYVMRGVKVYADAATRDAAYGGAGEPVLEAGEMCILTDTYTVQTYNGSRWRNVSPYGTGATFPTSPADGEMWGYPIATYSAIWYFRYDTASTKWWFAGGSPVFIQDLAQRSKSINASTWDFIDNTNDPQYTIPLAGDYFVRTTASLACAGAASVALGARVGTTDPVWTGATNTATAATVGAAGNATLSTVRYISGITASTVVRHRYWQNNAAAQIVSRYNATMEIWPNKI